MSRNVLRRSRAATAAIGVVAAAGLALAPSAMAEVITVPQPWRTLEPLASESIPRATCPDSHPNLAFQNFRRWGVSTPDGVDVENDSGTRVHVWIAAVSADLGPHVGVLGDRRGTPRGTWTGGQWTGATNWSLERASYRLILKCTDQGYGSNPTTETTYPVTDRSLGLPTDPQAHGI